jgi:hypothetical protein
MDEWVCLSSFWSVFQTDDHRAAIERQIGERLGATIVAETSYGAAEAGGRLATDPRLDVAAGQQRPARRRPGQDARRSSGRSPMSRLRSRPAGEAAGRGRDTLRNGCIPLCSIPKSPTFHYI